MRTKKDKRQFRLPSKSLIYWRSLQPEVFAHWILQVWDYFYCGDGGGTSAMIRSCEHKNNGLSAFIVEDAGNAAENATNCGAAMKLTLKLQMALL